MLDLDSPINHEWGINVYVYISVNALWYNQHLLTGSKAV